MKPHSYQVFLRTGSVAETRIDLTVGRIVAGTLHVLSLGHSS